MGTINPLISDTYYFDWCVELDAAGVPESCGFPGLTHFPANSSPCMAVEHCGCESTQVSPSLIHETASEGAAPSVPTSEAGVVDAGHNGAAAHHFMNWLATPIGAEGGKHPHELNQELFEAEGE